MNFDFTDDQELLRDQLRRLLADRCSSTEVRNILDGSDPFDRSLYKDLAKLGVLGAAIPEEYGGVGLGQLELCILAEELGRVNAPTPTASSIYIVAQILIDAGTDVQKMAWLPKLASAEAVGCFALAERPGRVLPNSIHASVEAGKLRGIKIPVADGDCADVAVVAAHSDNAQDEVSLFLVDLNGPGVQRETLENIDPTRSQARLIFDNAPAEPLGSLGAARPTISRALNRAAVLVAFEQLGGADRTLEMARDYALDRMAFGRQIGSFQAIKHMLADMYVAATLARSNAYYGAWALSKDAADLPVAAAAARVSATQAFQLCAKNNIQVHGGIGFTWEVDCHLFYRRSNALALALGSLSTWEDLLVERLSQQHNSLAA